MTTSHAERLASRRQSLVVQAGVQRLQLRRDVHALGAALDPAVFASRLLGRVRARPSLVLVPIALLFGTQSGSIGRFARRAIVGWRLWQALRGWPKNRQGHAGNHPEPQERDICRGSTRRGFAPT